jgi:hypothetical protein
MTHKERYPEDLCRMRRRRNNGSKMRQRRLESTANDSNSSKVHRRESCLATVQIKAVSLPRHADEFCLLYLSDDVASPFLSPHLAPGVRRCSAITLRRGGASVFFGLPMTDLQVLSPTTRLFSRHQLIHLLRGGIACAGGVKTVQRFASASANLRPATRTRRKYIAARVALPLRR